MIEFEVIIVDLFDFLLNKTLIPALVLTATICALTGVIIIATKIEKSEQKPDSTSKQTPILYEASIAFKWLIHKWITISLILMLLTAVVYGMIFDYSLHVWNGMLPKREFEQTLTSRIEYRDIPLSCPTNLIGVRKSEIENVLGTADYQGFIEKYDGVRKDGRKYYIRIVYLPIVQRVAWYETAVIIG